MNTRSRLLSYIVLLIVAAVLLATIYYTRRQSTSVRAELVTPPVAGFVGLSEPATVGFTRADGSRSLSFPQDFGPHPDFQTEWWYYTGNLDSLDGRHFGYQLTFFRRALLPPDQRTPRLSDWKADQVYMAHFAITDVSQREHLNFERLTRGAAGLSGAQAVPFQVWLEDWSVTEIAPRNYQLKASQGSLALDLSLVDLKGPVLQSRNGYSQKGPDPGNASYYYSLTRLQTSGTVGTKNGSYNVTGGSWMDHEFSTSALSPNQVGWDWFSIQLENNTELMFFQIRQADGSVDPYSGGTIVIVDGSSHPLQKDDFLITVEDTWRSPRSGAQYPSRWNVRLPAEGLTLEIIPYLENQEMILSYIYWEGAVRVKGMLDDQEISGNGYVEMTGYAQADQVNK
jgi:predicted secreted hydrolase